MIFGRGDVLIHHLITGGVSLNVRLAIAMCMALAILLAVVVYVFLIIITRTVTLEDMKLIPKGEKIAKILKVKSGVTNL